MSTSRISMSVSLTPELEQFIQSRVATGRYLSTSEVVREALRFLQEREAAFASFRTELPQKIEAAEADVAQGHVFTPETYAQRVATRKRQRNTQ